MELNISPAISVFAHHHGKRLAAGVYFEIAAKYAEKVGGEIIQRATVVGCKSGDHPQELIIASYPHLPMNFERICAGFRSVLLEAQSELLDIELPNLGQTRDGHPKPAQDLPDLGQLYGGTQAAG